ncbi:kynurenine 3-monooxygenase-like [Penaeus chinensis]|uniref:kynurenine 3-monooxygenase-like n=1 Tax=Penaeus chinensis TaxID=139456 RepID=UPI001FB82F3D|nr:kynurenine 3-monooxygenase-like [Penaeus chinensis]
MKQANSNKKVIVVGAGLVGSLEACYLAKRGYEVHLYEYRDDIRNMEHVPGRSINLAMSIRGRTGLKAVGVEEKIIREHGIPMYARMIHNRDGSTKAIPYNKDGKCIYSVGRRFVNEVLLTRAEEFPNVTIHFHHKLLTADLERGKVTFLDTMSQDEVTVDADLTIGCDGAYSNMRKQMMKRPMFNYRQQYIPHGYMELCIPPGSDGNFQMPPNYLHIWPRGQYMMIALPNQDKSWTVTLFMPFEIFNTLDTPELLLDFFKTNYPDAITLVGKEKLIHDFFANKALPMISVKCSPYHVGSTSLLMGDAAHAMVPFYGQGMNCGMEDCVVLDEMMDRYEDDLTRVLPAYSEHRNPDAEAIVDLAMYNYIEMRDLVNSKLFLLRKKWDDLLSRLLPRTWVPLYTMVTFSRERYHLCIAKKRWQDEMIGKLVKVSAVAGIILGFFAAKTQAAHAFSHSLVTHLNSITAKTLDIAMR